LPPVNARACPMATLTTFQRVLAFLVPKLCLAHTDRHSTLSAYMHVCSCTHSHTHTHRHTQKPFRTSWSCIFSSIFVFLRHFIRRRWLQICGCCGRLLASRISTLESPLPPVGHQFQPLGFTLCPKSYLNGI